MLERTELCCYCEKRSATMTHEEIKNGRTQTYYYCQHCYERLFLFDDAAFFDEAEKQKSVCPDCGRTAKEFFKTGLVGCANCYRYLKKEIYPSIVKMQGDRAHCGKRSALSEEREKLILRRNEARNQVERLMSEHRFEEAQAAMQEFKRLNALLYGEEKILGVRTK